MALCFNLTKNSKDFLILVSLKKIYMLEKERKENKKKLQRPIRHP